MNNIIRNTLIGLALVCAVAAIELELEGSQGMEACTVLISSFDVNRLECSL